MAKYQLLRIVNSTYSIIDSTLFYETTKSIIKYHTNTVVNKESPRELDVMVNCMSNE